MITVITQSGQKFQFKYGQRKTQITGRIISLEADGEELKAIKAEFEGLIYPRNAPSVCWLGDQARHIWINL